MNVADLNGKPFTLWLTDEADESAVFPGIARWDGSTLVIERSPKPPFQIREEWYQRIQTAENTEVRDILRGADYFLHLRVGNLPEGKLASEYEQTGLKWPGSE